MRETIPTVTASHRADKERNCIMWKSKLRKDNEFLKRLVTALLSKTDVCDICVFGGTIPNSCELHCNDCASPEKGISACCTCTDNCNFLWNGKSPK